MSKSVYVVTSFTNTVPGKLIVFRASMKFWNRYPGDIYSHASLSLDKTLSNMYSFARKEINQPLNAGLVKENINEGLFLQENSRIAVMELEISKEKYNEIMERINFYWQKKDTLDYNFLGLFKMLLLAKGTTTENHYFCSQWVSTVLSDCGIKLFEDKENYDIKPFDFYNKLKENIIYEGKTCEYPFKDENQKIKKKGRI